MSGITGNPKSTRVALVVLALITACLAYCSKVRAEEPKFFVSFGEAYAVNNPLAGAMRLGLEYGPFQASLVTHGSSYRSWQDVTYFTRANMGACGTWHRGFHRFSVGWGACLFEHGDWSVGDSGPVVYDRARDAYELDDDGVQLTAAIVLRRTFGKNEHFYVEAFHASTGGSTYYNGGRNLLTGGIRF